MAGASSFPEGVPAYVAGDDVDDDRMAFSQHGDDDDGAAPQQGTSSRAQKTQGTPSSSSSRNPSLFSLNAPLGAAASIGNYPHLLRYVSQATDAGVTITTPYGADLIAALEAGFKDNAPTRPLAHGLLHLLDTTLGHHGNTIRDTTAQRDALQQEMNTLRAELLLTTEQLHQLRDIAASGPARRRPLMKDPEAFAGEEKDALKRHDAFAD